MAYSVLKRTLHVYIIFDMKRPLKMSSFDENGPYAILFCVKTRVECERIYD